MSDDIYNSSEDFLSKMDAGDFDQSLSTEIKKLSPDQLEQLAKTLMDRDKKRSEPEDG